MSAGEKRFCASCTVERVGQGAADDGCGRKRGFARCGATEHWHCQALLAGSAHAPLNIGTARFIWQEPPSSGTAKDRWRETPVCHPALALPVFFRFRCFFATQLWHCQGILAPWRPYVLASPTSHSANCNAACANCNASSLALPVQWSHKRYEPNRKEHPHVHRTLHRVLHRHDPRHCLCLPLHPCSAGKVSPLSSPDNLFLSHTPSCEGP